MLQATAGSDATGGEASLLFTGSVIEKGRATAVVYAIGNNTELGKIAALSTHVRKVTQHEKALQAFSSLLIHVVLVALALTLVAKLLLVHDLSELPPVSQRQNCTNGPDELLHLPDSISPGRTNGLLSCSTSGVSY